MMDKASTAARRLFDPAIQEQMLELYERMISCTHITDVLQHAAEAVKESMAAERATIYLVRNDTQELESVALVGNVSQRIRVPIRKESLAGFCACTAGSFVVPDAYADLSPVDPGLRFDKSWDEMNSFRTRDVVCAPALFLGKVTGVVQAINHRDTPFSEHDIAPLESIAKLIAYSLYHAQLYEELESLKALKKEKAKFMRVLVHELKSPAAGAKMLVSALRCTHEDDERVSGALSKIEGRMDRMLAMVGDILDHSRIYEGTAMDEVLTTDLREVVRAVAEGYDEQARAKGLSLLLNQADTELPVRFDRQGIDLVVSNLLSNAIKYTAEGSVTLQTRQEGAWAVLAVTDTGMGIPAADMPTMFKEFFRASNARESEIEGTGVGLAGIKDLVERFQGTLAIESEENVGSTFSVRIPVAETAPSG